MHSHPTTFYAYPIWNHIWPLNYDWPCRQWVVQSCWWVCRVQTWPYQWIPGCNHTRHQPPSTCYRVLWSQAESTPGGWYEGSSPHAIPCHCSLQSMDNVKCNDLSQFLYGAYHILIYTHPKLELLNNIILALSLTTIASAQCIKQNNPAMWN